MCPCGGELTVWCFEHGDWVCDDCGCSECRDQDAWAEEYDEDDHDERHPWMFAGCEECDERANWLEERYQYEQRAGATS